MTDITFRHWQTVKYLEKPVLYLPDAPPPSLSRHLLVNPRAAGSLGAGQETVAPAFSLTRSLSDFIVLVISSPISLICLFALLINQLS